MFEAYAQTPDAVVGAETPAAAPEPDTLGEALQTDPGLALDKVESWVEGFQRLLPNIFVALVLLLVFVGIGWGMQQSLIRWGNRRDRGNLGAVLGSFLKWVVILVGMLLALMVVVPTFNPGDLIAGLGITSVAIGFAFKDILQNWLAGLLILIRRPFRVGDEIVVNGYEGRVERIETRATMIRTYDGRRAIIPNADVYSNAVTVNTAYETRRSEYVVGIGSDQSIEDARTAILKALAEVDGVQRDPAPEVLAWEIAPSSMNLKVFWWTDSHRASVLHIQGAVVEAIRDALDRAGINMPYPHQVVLFHDETEGDGSQYERTDGQPPREDGARPGPARQRG